MQTHSIKTDCPVDRATDWGRETALSVQALSAADEPEVLDFLAARPIHTVFIKGFIKDNGLVNDLNRGKFYACRNGSGQLLGVALLGHITLIETHLDAVLRAFATYASASSSIYMVLGEEQKVRCFWEAYSARGDEPHQKRRELLFVQQGPPAVFEPTPELRLATPEDLYILLPLYGEMHRQESGVNPLDVDAGGFSRRWLRRIKKKKVWVWIQGERLIFNAVIMSDTSECIYLEGIYTAPEMRRLGYGHRCLSQLSHTLLARTKWLCLLSDDRNLEANIFYQQAGYEVASHYETIFLSWKN